MNRFLLCLLFISSFCWYMYTENLHSVNKSFKDSADFWRRECKKLEKINSSSCIDTHRSLSKLP
jgi:Ca2+-dependent lipid-binding protein